MKTLNILVTLVTLSYFQTACEQTGHHSTAKDFATVGKGTPVSTNDLPEAFKAKLLNPDSVLGTAQEGTSELWAGYTDAQNQWGQTTGDCKKKDNEVYCTKNNSFLFSGQGSNMGMEMPLVFPVSKNASYALMQASRSLGLTTGLSDRGKTHSEKVSIEKFAGVNSKIAGKTKSANEVYVIKTSSKNTSTNLALNIVYYFTSVGDLVGVAVRQEQKFNEQTQIQTAEWQLPGNSGQAKPVTGATFPIVIN